MGYWGTELGQDGQDGGEVGGGGGECDVAVDNVAEMQDAGNAPRVEVRYRKFGFREAKGVVARIGMVLFSVDSVRQ